MIESLSILVSNVNDKKSPSQNPEYFVGVKRNCNIIQFDIQMEIFSKIFAIECTGLARVIACVSMPASISRIPEKMRFLQRLSRFNLVCIPHILIVHTSSEYIRKQSILKEMVSIVRKKWAWIKRQGEWKTVAEQSNFKFHFCHFGGRNLDDCYVYMDNVEWVLENIPNIIHSIKIFTNQVHVSCRMRYINNQMLWIVTMQKEADEQQQQKYSQGARIPHLPIILHYSLEWKYFLPHKYIHANIHSYIAVFT